MRISIVLLLCLLIVVVNSATKKTTRRLAVVTAGRGTTKAPVPKSAYAYLRTVRGKKSCAGGSCPFWERHGRSFVSLRCYSEQYQECVCLHRMCFSSCLFSRQVCNQEMVSCLRQICPRCTPAAQLGMCTVYNSLAVSVTNALAVFACYPCCPNLNNSPTNTNGNTSITIAPPTGNIPSVNQGTPGAAPLNGVTNGGGNVGGGGNTGGGVNVGGGGNAGGGVNVGGGGNAVSAVNGQGTNGVNSPGNSNGGSNANQGAVFPGSNSAVNGNSNNPNPNQRIQKTVRPTVRRAVTTRRTSVTARRTATTVRKNNVKSTARTPVQAQKKP